MEHTTPNSAATEHADVDNTEPRESDATERATCDVTLVMTTPSFGSRVLMQSPSLIVLDALGPDVYHLRATCQLYRRDDFDLPQEVLRWLCVNSPKRVAQLMSDSNIRTELLFLGKLPLQCRCCTIVSNTRPMYRAQMTRKMMTAHPRFRDQPKLYMCCLCIATHIQEWLCGGDDLFDVSSDTGRMRCLTVLYSYIVPTKNRKMNLFESVVAGFSKGKR